jgi:hypothetical protein
LIILAWILVLTCKMATPVNYIWVLEMNCRWVFTGAVQCQYSCECRGKDQYWLCGSASAVAGMTIEAQKIKVLLQALQYSIIGTPGEC